MSEPSRHPVRRVLRALTHGVYVLGVKAGARDDFLVVSLAMQCSVEPPRVVFALTRGARVLGAIRQSGGCTLALIDATQRAAVKRYGTPGGVRHLPETPMRSALGGHPIIPECAGWLALSVSQEIVAGDHVLIIADVVEAGGAITMGDTPPPFTPMTLGDSGMPYGG